MKKRYFLGFALLSLGAVICLGGCSTILIFDPKGPIGDSIRFVIIAASVLMAIVVVPVFFMNFWFARKYRAANTRAKYMPKWHYSAAIDLTMWGVPIAIVVVLAILAWTRTHSLDPYKPIPSLNQPVNIEVVALDWKWLFIYPDENIAIVNEMTFPVKTPVSFKLTSETVMTSFFIPQLGSQIYAMAGMRTQLHLLADHPGSYDGHNQQFSGRYYSQMYFKAHAVTPAEYQAWVQKVRQSGEKLDLERYAKLINRNSGYQPPLYFAAVKPGLFQYILDKYRQHPEKIPVLSDGPGWPESGTSLAEGN
jgi:cytochrome o ubiquinol oxidase subunit II